MVTKEDISDKLNELLETTINFSKMTKEDLEVLFKIFSEPMALVHLGVNGMRAKAKKEFLDRPLKDILGLRFEGNSLLEGVRRNGGPLGLGILPRIFGERGSKAKNAVEKHKDEQQSKPSVKT